MKAKPVSTAVAAAVASLVNVFSHVADVLEASALETCTAAATTLDTIATLRGARGKDVAGYLGDVVAIFGTQGVHHTKPDYVAGALRTTLEKTLPGDADAKRDAMNRIKFRLSQARKVASFVADPAHVIGPDATLDSLYKLAKGAKPASERAPRATSGDAAAAAGEASSMTAAEAVKLFGCKALLAAIAASLATHKATSLQAKTVDAIAQQVAA